MNEDRKRGILKSKILTLIVITSMLAGSGTVSAIETNSEGSFEVTEQMQSQTAHGTVVDPVGDPVIGASILEKGTSNGTITDIDGNFSLNVKSGATLVISYIGFRTQEIKAGANMSITLAEDYEMLDEVVVVGYGVQKKKLLTGATVQVKGEDIAKLNTVNVMEAMQSQSPGLNIVQNSGFLGAGYKVTIRGIGTNGDAAPLYVVDGVPNGSLDGLSSNDIESIDILKDAASAAIYGARAANGVILVTTKQGKAGIFQASYDGYYGVQDLYKIPTVLSAKEYMVMQDEGRVMDGYDPYNWALFIPAHDLKAINDGTWTGTNWLKEMTNKHAAVQSHSLNFTGGNDRSTYAIGFNYTQQEATMGVPSAVPVMDRYNVRINSQHVLLRKNKLDVLSVGQTLNYKYQETQGSVAVDDIYWNSVHNMLVMSPLMHIYNSKGDYYMYQDQLNDGYSWDTNNGANRNPIAYLDFVQSQSLSKSHYLQGGLNLDFQPIKNLHIKSQFGYIMSASSYRSYQPAYGELSATLVEITDRVSQSMSLSNRWSWDNTISYKYINGDHNLDVLLGQSVEKWGMGESISGNNRNSSFYDFDHAYLSNVPGTANITSLTGSPYAQGRLASFFGRANYNYKEKYMASAVLRADGSSTFARGHRWGYFPSISAGWVISGEDFMKKVTFIDFLKLRASWGQNGNCNVATFQYLATITSNNNNGGYAFGGSMGDAATGSYTYRLTNPNLKWETQETLNFGVDARFFNNRLGIELDWYNRSTKGWLLPTPVILSLGAGPVFENGGDVRNTGVELGLHWNDQLGKDFTYGVNLSLGHNKNEVTKISNEEGIIHGPGSVFWNQSDEFFRAEVGKPFGYFYGYTTEGIFQNQEQIDNYKGAKLNAANTRPGDLIWTDIDKNGVINENDRSMIGNPHPDVTMGLSFNISYKGLDLSITTYGAFGQQIMKCYRDFVASPYNNYTTDIYERWHGEGTSNKLPRLSSAGGTNWTKISDIYMENGDYLKIKNVSLGYDLKKAFKKLPMQQLRIYVTAQNLFTFTGYSGMDPEVGYASGISWASGIDLGFYPSARTFMVGTNIKF
ncbi:SusC/RagA family TonB-linked outer membrane protein [Bacteroides sp. UBA939]|uniref:SusC/RagA family TonB-linked outer membrane protein n=1 Tax=Bacteroides sp. UBA939 TaxID=1946092 RepID=UPI0025B7D9F2|nr:TonB-dependent receptor [Bacteroides sp. UBA939]